MYQTPTPSVAWSNTDQVTALAVGSAPSLDAAALAGSLCFGGYLLVRLTGNDDACDIANAPRRCADCVSELASCPSGVPRSCAEIW